MNKNNTEKKIQKIEDNIKKINKLLSHIDQLSKEVSKKDNDDDAILKGDAEEQQDQGSMPLLEKKRKTTIILPSLSL
jgi:aspartyl aminopeptidase